MVWFCSILECVVPENIYTHPKDGHWKFQGGGGSERPKFLKKSMKLNWNFQRAGGAQSQKTIHGGCGYFLEPYNFG